MCKACYAYFMKQWSGLSLGEYLDGFEAPVVVINAEGRVVAASQIMADLMGKSRREMFGLLGGEALECQYSRLPEGCGGTVHCKTCVIRNTVSATLATGEPQTRVPAYLNRKNAPTRILISTKKSAGVVVVIIEDVVGR